jgi:hypothetical protein
MRDPLGRGILMRRFLCTVLFTSAIACRPEDGRNTTTAISKPPMGVADSQARISPRISTDSAQGTWNPPRFPGRGINGAATLSEDWMTTLRIGTQQIVFEQTPLDSLQLLLHTGPIGQAGDAGAFVQWLCFNGGTGHDQWVLWLEAGEMDAGTISIFHIVSVPPDSRIDHRCTELHSADTLALPRGLSLGQEESTVHRLMGPPSGSVGDTLVYSFERRPPAKAAVRTSIVLVTSARRLVQILGWRSSAW